MQESAPDLNRIPVASLKDRLLAALVRRLPRGRYPVASWLARGRRQVFTAPLRGTEGRLRFVCPINNWIAREVFYHGIYAPQETILCRHLLQPGMVFMDVGANWGYFSLLAADLVGDSGAVVAFEPHPRLAGLLEANVNLNQLKHVRTFRLAVADKEGDLSFADFPSDTENWGTAHLAVGQASSAGDFPVHAVSLSQALRRAGVDRVDLLKMDIEGAEALVLPAAEAEFAAHRIQRVLVEMHPQQSSQFGTAIDTLPGILLQHGYQAFLVDETPATSRALAYAPTKSPMGFMSAFDAGTPMRDRAHLLFLAPGVPATW